MSVDTYLGSQAHQGDYTFDHGLNNHSGDYTLRFYVKNVGSTINVAGCQIDLSQMQGSNYWVQKVDFDWYMVALDLTGLGTSILFNFQNEDSSLLDEITIVLAGSGAIETGDYNPPARVSLFGYDPWHRKVNAMTGPRGRTVRFTYDPTGNLWQTWDADGRLKTENYRISYGTSLPETP